MHNKPKILSLSLALITCFAFMQLSAQADYSNYSKFTQKIKNLQRSYSANCQLKTLTKTVGNYPIWALTLSNGKAENNPAIAIISGVDGKYLLGPEMAVNIAENLLKNHTDLLKKTTFYIFPNMSPNATENYFSSLKHYNNGNAKATDDDRDGATNEDPFEDLNHDGLITMMRVEDATGNYKTLKEDPRILVEADKEKGEKGTYKLYSEGIDNDKDGKFNEDGKGGVQFNKNFSFNFPYFKPGAGEYPVSEKENRALLDFLYKQQNIYAIITFGPENNLSHPLKYNASGAKKRIVTSILKDDATLNKFLSEKYNSIIGEKNAPVATGNGGDFFEWSYFHFGRLALSTPGWWVPTVKEKGKGKAKTSKNKVVNYLKWAKKEGVKNAFVDWTVVQSPDFPNQKVEVGGIAPYKMYNPPFKMVTEISKKHTDFIVQLAKMQPQIALENLKIEKVSNGLTRISVAVHNKGQLPTHTEMGKRSRWLRKIKLVLAINKNQHVISGKALNLISSINADDAIEFSWLVQGKGSVQLSVGAPQTGTDTASIQLK